MQAQHPIASYLGFNLPSTYGAKMRFNRYVLSGIALVVALLLTSDTGYAQSKRALTHDDVNAWNRISKSQLSRDGEWALWHVGPAERDGYLRIRSLSDSLDYRYPLGNDAKFSGDSDFAAFMIVPAVDSVRAAKLAEKKKDDLPKDSLGIVHLLTGETVRYARVKSFAFPEEAGGWIAVLLEKSEKKDSTSSATGTEEETTPAEPGEVAEKAATEKLSTGKKSAAEKKKEKEKKDGTTLIVRYLDSGSELQFDNVTEYSLDRTGQWLAFIRSDKKGDSDGAFLLAYGDSTETALKTGEGMYGKMTFDRSGTQLAFVSSADDYESDQPKYTLYRVATGSPDASVAAEFGMPGLPDGWIVSPDGRVYFSDSGSRLFFGSAPAPPPIPDDENVLDEEKVTVDIWSWSDPLLQPMQLKQLDSENKRSYLALVTDSGVVQIGTTEIPDVVVSQKGDGRVAMGRSNLPYRKEISWDSPRYYDAWIIDVETGSSRQVIQGLQDRPNLSPGGNYIVWWDNNELAWWSLSTDSEIRVNLTRDLPVRFDYALHDWPFKPGSEGSAGWTENDAWFLAYDQFDVWALDPNGERPAMNITDGVGRGEQIRFRVVDLDPEEPAISASDRLLLSALDMESKNGGFYFDRIDGTDRPQSIVMSGHQYRSVRKAHDADFLLYTRQNFREFPNLWTSDVDFVGAKKISEANPQQATFTWGTSELVHWTSLDGIPLTGILYKPDGFDPSRKYPMMVYFYEKYSDQLNRHYTPSAGSSSINFSFYVSRGYLLFVPDIPYKVGYPGESAMNAVMPGITSLIDTGFVEANHIGVQGHSWGGYQIAYMVTQTNLFAAAEAGAPVSNMTSAYGGIRWGSGMNRAFQYEKTQSRIGGTLWDATLRYIHNSPLFQAPKVETPLLMMHNDHDGAVPWYQGIEFFTALRRLGKKTWMFNYNGEDHGLRKLKNRKDWTIRLQQFFDHYLKGAPAPVWLKNGVPAIRKGYTLGLETDR